MRNVKKFETHTQQDIHRENEVSERRVLKLPLIISGVIILLILLGILVYFSYQYLTLKNQMQNSPLLTQQQILDLTKDAGKLIILPRGIPTVYTITDVSKLKNQAFFQNAENGDKILIYANERKVFIFSPNRNILVNVGPLNFTTTQQSQQIQQTPSVIHVGFRNGTSVVGLTNKVVGIVTSEIPHTTSAFREQDAKTTYQTTLVVVINPSAVSVANHIATILHSQVVTLPADEKRPTNADILVIVGKDQSL